MYGYNAPEYTRNQKQNCVLTYVYKSRLLVYYFVQNKFYARFTT